MLLLLQDKGTELDPYDVDGAWFESCPLEEMRVVGIDPGLRDFVTGAVRGDCKESPDTFR